MDQDATLFRAKCPHCGGNFDLDIDQLVGQCPYCDSEVALDSPALREAQAQREKTKRLRMQLEHEKEQIAMEEGRQK